MKLPNIKSASEQVADHLKAEIISKTWIDIMPGETHLLKCLGVGKATIKAALSILEQEGILMSQGPNRRRKIVLTESLKVSSLRIGILCYDESDRVDFLMNQLVYSLRERGYAAFLTTKTLQDLKMDVGKVSEFIKKNNADAWILNASPRSVTQWFIEEKISVFALYGGQIGLPIAGISADHKPAIQAVIERLVELGHRRIVSLSNRGRHVSAPGGIEKFFLEELERCGIPTSSYNLPSWEDGRDGFRKCLEALFEHTPPTALIIEEPSYFFAALQFCGERGLRIPHDVSLICSEYTEKFDVMSPEISHISWDNQPIIRRVLRWTNSIDLGKEDKLQSQVKTKFLETATISSAP